MKDESGTNISAQYMTWYEFKKELEKRAGHPVLNWDWQTVKPKTPLPWNNTNMQAALLQLSHQGNRNNPSIKTRQTVY